MLCITSLSPKEGAMRMWACRSAFNLVQVVSASVQKPGNWRQMGQIVMSISLTKYLLGLHRLA